MLLFILSYDPILRWISSLTSPLDAHLFGMCDDLAVATANIPGVWHILARALKAVENFSSLRINKPKTQFLPANLDGHDDVFDLLIEIDPSLPRDSIKHYVKYLGIHIGPEAHINQWKLAIEGHCEVTRTIKSFGAGLVTSIVLYNVLAHSKLTYIASFVEPGEEVIVAERRAQQIITNGPWFSFSPKLMQNLRSIGFGVECRVILLRVIPLRPGRGTLYIL